MSAEIINTGDNILTVKISGKLTQPQLAAVQQKAAQCLRDQSKLRILVITEKFEGWDKSGDWGDVSFQFEQDEHIEKMAIIGEQKWRDLMLVFAAQGFRKFPVEYFLPQETVKARAWLAVSAYDTHNA